jgi:CSLREA domain-containing protein
MSGSSVYLRFRGRYLLAVVALIAGLALTVGPLPTAHAASFTSTRFDDPSPNGCVPADCSLREAIMAANAAPGHDTVHLRSGVYVLSIPIGLAASAADGDLNIAGDLTISGAGAGASIVDGTGIDRVFAIDMGSVQIEHVTIQNGNAHDGGGILNMSVLRLHDSIVRDNIASEHGAGIGNRGDMTLTNSIVRDNRTDESPETAPHKVVAFSTQV